MLNRWTPAGEAAASTTGRSREAGTPPPSAPMTRAHSTGVNHVFRPLTILAPPSTRRARRGYTAMVGERFEEVVKTYAAVGVGEIRRHISRRCAMIGPYEPSRR